MQVLLINPDWKELVSKKSRLINRRWPPLDLLNCSALLEKQGIETEVLDARAGSFSLETIQNKINAADLTFITSSPLDRWQCPNPEVEDFIAFIRQLENKQKVYVMGVHSTIYPEKILNATGVAGVIVGQPEFAVRQICQIKPQIKIIGSIEVDLGQFPLPRYDKIDLNDYYYELMGGRFALLETSRGCPFSCSFCLKRMYGDRVKKKPLEQIKKEIDYIVLNVKAKNVYFIDLEFTLEKEKVVQICEYILNQKYRFDWCCQTRADTVDRELLMLMRRAGCSLIHFGIDSGSQRILDMINKKTRLTAIKSGIELAGQAGIATAGFFMFGFPGETREEMNATIAFARSLPLDYASFHAVIPYPTTKLMNELLTDEMFPENNISQYSKEFLTGLARHAYFAFYFRIRYIIRLFLKPGLLAKQIKLFYSFIK